MIKTSGDATLVTFNLAADAFGDAVAGVITLSGTPISATASASGTADHAELISNGSTYQITALTVGLSAANVILDNLAINSGQECELNSFTWTESATVN